jgi:hypothetical protein
MSKPKTKIKPKHKDMSKPKPKLKGKIKPKDMSKPKFKLKPQPKINPKDISKPNKGWSQLANLQIFSNQVQKIAKK